MNELKTFNYNNSDVRAVTINDEPWFIAKDVCEVLGYTNPSAALDTNVPEKHKRRLTYGESLELNIFSSNPKGTLIIDEPGLYRLTIRSHNPKAEEFTDWITEEVIPSIRKTGGYLGSIEDDDEYAIMTKALDIAHRHLEERNKVINKQDSELKELRPKATYYDKILQNPSLMLTRDWSKDYGFSSYQVNRYLTAEGICGRVKTTSEDIFPKRPYDKMNIMATFSYPGTKRTIYKWTQQGRLYIHGKFTEMGIKALEDGGDAERNIAILKRYWIDDDCVEHDDNQMDMFDLMF